jgi:hypothetical protein
MLERSIALLTCSILVFPAVAYSWGNKGIRPSVGLFLEAVTKQIR